MAKDAQKAALLNAKRELLAAYGSVQTSLAHLINVVNNSDPRAIAETLGSNPALPVSAEPTRYAHSSSPNMQMPSQHLPSHHPHAVSHSRQVPPKGPAGPSFTSVVSFPVHPRAQSNVKATSTHAAGMPVPESEDDEDEEEHEEAMSEDDQAGPTQAQHTYTAATAQPVAKKVREKKIKKERDPNAPKRPASAYILFQNAVRQEMRAANPTVDYKELARQIGDRWKSLSEDAKRPWSEAGKQAMSSWNTLNREYKTTHPETVQATSPHTLSTASSAAAVPVKRRRAPKSAPTLDAQGNPVKKKRGRPSKADKVEQDVTQPHPVQHALQHAPPPPRPQQYHPQPPQHQQYADPQQQTGRWPDTAHNHGSEHLQNGHAIHSNGNGATYVTAPQHHHTHAHQGHGAADEGSEEEDEEEEEEEGAESETDSAEDPRAPPHGAPGREVEEEEEDEDEDEDEEPEEEETDHSAHGRGHPHKKMRGSDS